MKKEDRCVVYFGNEVTVQVDEEVSAEYKQFKQTFLEKYGSIVDKDGLDQEKWEFIYNLKVLRRGRIKEYAEKYNCEYYEGKRPWGLIDADIALPCATENELNLEETKALVDKGCFCVIEGANMPTTLDAIKFLQEKKYNLCSWDSCKCRWSRCIRT